MMKKGRLTIIATFLFILGCASSGNKRTIVVPVFTGETLYAYGVATRVMEQQSIEAARLNARNELASQIETHVRSLTKNASEQVGIGRDTEINNLFSSAVKATVDQTLNFSVPHEPPVTKDVENGQNRTEVVYKLDVGPVNQAMLDNIKERKMLNERMRTSELFNELEEEIEKKRAN